MEIKFEGYERRIDKINACLNENGIKDLEDAYNICTQKGINVDEIVRNIQPIAFENAIWAYTAGCAIAIKKGCKVASDAAESIGVGLQAFCIPGSVADQRSVGLGHGNLAAKLLREETKCFAFLAGHESFAAAEGAIGIARTANTVRKTPLKVILNGLGKDAAYIISRINGFTYVKTEFNQATGELKVISTTAMVNVLLLEFLVLMMLTKVLQLCKQKKLTFLLLVTLLTQLVSNIQLLVLTKNFATKKVLNTSQLQVVAVLVELFTQIIWLLVLLLMV